MGRSRGKNSLKTKQVFRTFCCYYSFSEVIQGGLFKQIPCMMLEHLSMITKVSVIE